ncbi:MAG TPA: hypothetical protein VK586_24755, partial [Streptosporangiaceae bacterium]|nr:hypothetical protein [Streptosporangiaceae bacterium]
MYALDITTSGEDTQLVFYAAFPSDGTSLTEADAADLADGVRTSVLGLSGVTGCTLTPMKVNGVQIPDEPSFTEGQTWSFTFPASEWANYWGEFAAPYSFEPQNSAAGFMARSPADGVLSSGDLDSVASDLSSALNGLTGVSG